MNNVYDIIRNDLNETNSNYCYSTTNNLINQSSCYMTNYYKNDFNIGPSYNLGFNSTDESTSSSFINSDSNDSTYLQSYNYKQSKNLPSIDKRTHYMNHQNIYNTNRSIYLNEIGINDKVSSRSNVSDSFSNLNSNQTIAANRSKRRTRVRYNQYQLDKMEEVFKMNRYPDARHIEDLAEMLNLTFKNVTYWFQNRRSKLKASAQ